MLDLVGVNNINQVQQSALQSRLHIPVIFGLDVIHGYKTIFPVPIGEASSWDPAAVQNDESISASEATADGIKWTFNPMVDVTRDPRWGRVVEGAGEDPFLGSAIAAAKVRGYQGSDFSAPDRMAATVKHFAGYGAPVAGREYNTVDMSERQLRNIYLPPYKAAVDAGAATVMSAFNSLDGVPASANPYLLTTILRNEWKFGGTVVSDYQAIQELEAFGYATSGAEAAQLALTAGVDIEMGVQVPSQYSTYTRTSPTPDPWPVMTSPSSTPIRTGRAFCSPSGGSTDSSGSRWHQARPRPSPSRWGRATSASTTTRGQFEVDPGVVSVYVGDSSTGGLPGQFTVR